ncbi:MAG TPA: hypothetical protein VK628_08340 [Flavitalea sp.]|nr:hypothetical protein [Flavitalea sp.]
MKRIFPLGKTALVLLFALQMMSCHKFIDKYFPGHGHGEDEPKYRIKSMILTLNGNSDAPAARAMVYYNQHNDPDSVIVEDKWVDIGTSELYKYYYFTYDNEHRLTRYWYTTRRGTDSLFSNYHWYEHDNTGRIIKDSTLIIEYDFDFDGAYEHFSSVSYPEYDSEGRVVKDGGSVYKYDSSGNRERIRDLYDPTHDSVVYDNKVNYKLTNKVWTFISRDYSKNNADRATGYNDAGLPLGFRDGTVYGFLDQGDPYEIEWDLVP